MGSHPECHLVRKKRRSAAVPHVTSGEYSRHPGNYLLGWGYSAFLYDSAKLIDVFKNSRYDDRAPNDYV